MEIFSFLRAFVLLCVLAAAAVTDACCHKIYNNLILLGFFCEAAVCAVDPPETDPYALSYLLMFLLLLLFFYWRKMLGGADAKLYMLAVFSFPNACGCTIVVLSIVFSAVYAAGMAVVRAQTAERGSICSTGVPMGVFLFAGALAVLL